MIENNHHLGFHAILVYSSHRLIDRLTIDRCDITPGGWRYDIVHYRSTMLI
ncbi:hypothetical protein [Bradyrhizobium sp. dw_78]|uniref:hypothetical protein n=1 Tax=Bradyrhizobium sp. dw_78 TaxID=2719793 RepID=UPI001BD4C168|nr:hypothetical protein [Bradyrhizobium sp. dw_78]